MDFCYSLLLNLVVVHDIAHKLHGIVPGIELPLLPRIQPLFANKCKYLLQKERQIGR